MPSMRFTAELSMPDPTAKIGSQPVITLPMSASVKLPSRGMTMVEGTINGFRFRTVLEPNGQGSHWFRLDKAMRKSVGLDIGGTAHLEIVPTKVWPEPEVTADLQNALAANPQAHALWMDITPMARWDWLNWMDAVKQAETRRERPNKLISMLKSGKRRPCCFNRTLLTTPKSAEPL